MMIMKKKKKKKINNINNNNIYMVLVLFYPDVMSHLNMNVLMIETLLLAIDTYSQQMEI